MLCSYIRQISSYITLSQLRSKEIAVIHKPCIPHSNDSSGTTEYNAVYIQIYTVTRERGEQVYSTL